jgi:hypothetical protein
MPMDHNPHIARARQAKDDKGTEAGIEIPDRVENIAWQTRPALPTAAENAFGDALQRIFGDEIHDLAEIVARLNQAGIAPPAGASAWTEVSLRAELARLGF